MNFDEWVFDELVKVGAIKDYTKEPAIGTRRPNGTLSIRIHDIVDMKRGTDLDKKLWGLIGATLYPMSDTPRKVSTQARKEFEAYAAQVYPQDPAKLVEVMKKACLSAW